MTFIHGNLNIICKLSSKCCSQMKIAFLDATKGTRRYNITFKIKTCSTLLWFFIFKLVIGKTTVKIVKVSKSVIFSKTKWCKKTFKLWKQFTIEAIFKKWKHNSSIEYTSLSVLLQQAHFRPIFSFCTPLKHQKGLVFYAFKKYEKKSWFQMIRFS